MLLGPLAYVALSIAVVLSSAGALIEGRVADSKGVPIAAASIWLRPADFPLEMVDQEESGEPTARTDAGGRFRITGLPAGTQVHLRIEHAGYASLEVPGVEAPTRETLQLEMKTARGLAGRVLGPDGEPVADAVLKKGGLSLSDASLSMSDRPVLARTDAQGGSASAVWSPDRSTSASPPGTTPPRRCTGFPSPRTETSKGSRSSSSAGPSSRCGCSRPRAHQSLAPS